MPLTEEQEKLFKDLLAAIKEDKDIGSILTQAETHDLLGLFELFKQEGKKEEIENINFLCKLLTNQKHRLAFFNVVKEKGILGEILNINLVYLGQKFQSSDSVDDEKNTLNVATEYKLADFIADSEVNRISILDEIKETFGLEKFCKASSVKNRNIIKGALEREIGTPRGDQEKSKYQGWLKEIEITELKMKAKNKAIGVGFTCGGISMPLIVIGYFAYVAAVGVVSILPLIVMFAAILLVPEVVRYIAGGITYAILKPSNELNEIDVQQKVSRESEVAA